MKIIVLDRELQTVDKFINAGNLSAIELFYLKHVLVQLSTLFPNKSEKVKGRIKQINSLMSRKNEDNLCEKILKFFN